MIKKMKKGEIIDYWLSSSDKDFKAMGSLLKSGHYVWTLFLGHLILEKLLKAIYVKNVNANIPLIHNLSKIAEEAKLDISGKQKDLLDEITTFNISARYPDYKGRFYKKANKGFTEEYVKKIKRFRQWLRKKVKE